MIRMTEEIGTWIDRNAGATELAAEQYIDPADGLIHCKACKGQRQTVVSQLRQAGIFYARCVCCVRPTKRKRKEAAAQRERMERIKRRKAQGLQKPLCTTILCQR